MNEFIITEQEIVDQLKILNVNKPAGPDGASPRLLKDIAYSISKPLTKFFNMSLSIKQIPILWKIAHVSPIFKGKGNPHSSQNYRPISVRERPFNLKGGGGGGGGGGYGFCLKKIF